MRKRKSILRKLFFLCIVGVFAASTVGCGGSTDDECGDDEAEIGGECLTKCDTDQDCSNQGETCEPTSADFGVCQASGATGGTTGGSQGSGTTGGTSGGETGGTTGGTSGGETGGTTGGQSGGETGGTTGGETGGTTGGESGGTVGGETGGTSTGGTSGGETGGTTGGGGSCPDLQNCGQMNCGSAQQGADQSLCLLNKCESEYTMCGLTGSKACDDIYSCLNQCSQGDSQCQQGCLTSADVSGQKAFWELQKCGSANNCSQSSDPNCLLNNCEMQYKTCGLAGMATCDEPLRCLQACPQGDTTCQNNCPDRTVAASKQWSNLISCGRSAVQNGNCSDLTLSCLMDNCEMQYTNCGLSGQGAQSCKGISDCQSKCGQSDTRCQVDCLFDATAQTQKDYFAFNDCASNKCGMAQDQFSCILTNCTNEWQGCGYTGMKACDAILSCQQNCPQGDQACSSNCLYEANLQGQKDYASLLSCADQNCQNASNQQQCLQSNCSMELSKCQPSMN